VFEGKNKLDFLFAAEQFPHFGGGSIVECWPEHGNYEMREMRRVLVELEVTRDTVVGEIFCDTRFGNTEMLGEAGLDGLRAPATAGAA
jgi:hypothetical protein